MNNKLQYTYVAFESPVLPERVVIGKFEKYDHAKEATELLYDKLNLKNEMCMDKSEFMEHIWYAEGFAYLDQYYHPEVPLNGFNVDRLELLFLA